MQPFLDDFPGWIAMDQVLLLWRYTGSAHWLTGCHVHSGMIAGTRAIFSVSCERRMRPMDQESVFCCVCGVDLFVKIEDMSTSPMCSFLYQF